MREKQREQASCARTQLRCIPHIPPSARAAAPSLSLFPSLILPAAFISGDDEDGPPPTPAQLRPLTALDPGGRYALSSGDTHPP